LKCFEISAVPRKARKNTFDLREYIYICIVTELAVVTFIFTSIIKKCAE
jgi:hypothetical protein